MFYCIRQLTESVVATVSQRSDIVKAVYEPTDEECEWKADEEEELTVSKQVQVTTMLACLPPFFSLLFPLLSLAVVGGGGQKCKQSCLAR